MKNTIVYFYYLVASILTLTTVGQDLFDSCPNFVYSDAKEVSQLVIKCGRYPQELAKPSYCWKSNWWHEFDGINLPDLPDAFGGYVETAKVCTSKCFCQILFNSLLFHCASMGVPVIWSTYSTGQGRTSANCEQTILPDTVTAKGNMLYLKISSISTVATQDPFSKFLANVPLNGFESGATYNIYFSDFLLSKRDSLYYLLIGWGDKLQSTYSLLDTISKLKNLEILCLNLLTFPLLPDQAEFAGNLKVFRLNGLPGLVRLPAWLSQAANLEYLMIRLNYNVNFTLDLPTLPKLTHLTLLRIAMKNITIKFRDVSLILERMDFSYSYLEYFAADTFGGLTKLKYLDVSNTKLMSVLPLMKLTNLRELYLSGVIPFPKNGATCILVAGQNANSKLSLNRDFFRSFPHLVLLEMMGYAELNITDDALIDLTELKVLWLSCNSLTKAPTFALRVCGLKEIYLDRNSLATTDSIPLTAVNMWANLNLLHLMYNPMKILPPVLYAMTNQLDNNAKQVLVFGSSINPIGQSLCEMYKLHLSNLEKDFVGTTMNVNDRASCEKEFRATMVQLEANLSTIRSDTSNMKCSNVSDKYANALQNNADIQYRSFCWIEGVMIQLSMFIIYFVLIN